MFHYHRNHNADITLVYKTLTEDAHGESWVLDTGKTGRIHRMRMQDGAKVGSKLFLGAILMSGDLFVTMVRQAYAQNPNQNLNDVLARNMPHLRIFGFETKGYARRILSVRDFFEANMDMLNIDNWRDVFRRDRKIYTKIKDEAPAKYMADAKVTNSLVANGCIIEGTVENSILFRKVRIGRNAVVRNSILMQNAEVGDEAYLDYVICDKDRSIQPEARLIGTAEEPLTIVKHEVV
jgi:glucose-1-phosphate adenylyltransferase